MIKRRWLGAKGAEHEAQNEKKTPFFKRLLFWRYMPLTIKTTVVFGALFTVIMVLFAVSMILGVQSAINSGHLIAGEGFSLFWTYFWAIFLVGVLAAVAIALGALASRIMLSPIRKMTDKIDEITENNLSVRLDDVDNQDELRELTKRINGLLTVLDEAFDRQSNFVTDAGHELKTPIAVLQGYSRLLKRWGTTKPEILQESIDAIWRESNNMQKLVEQLSALARLGKTQLNKTEFSVAAALEEVIAGYGVMETGHIFVLNKPPTDEVKVNGDKELITRSVRALIDNAIKYTDKGSTVTVGTFADDFDNAVIYVEDNGDGISEEDMPKVFDRFFRCDKARSRQSGSSGLGLSIAKSIADLHEGDITVTSVLGAGSKFTIRLPL